MIDVGKGVERELNISKEKLNEAIMILEREGYEVYGRGVAQVTNPGKQTNIKVLCKPGTDYKDVYDSSKIKSVEDYISNNNGASFRKAFEYPESLDSKRVKIKYAEEGGINKDGVIEIRRGVEDLNLGESHYAQVRIMVDGTHYMKGMAVYSDNMPDDVDVIFNTNKKLGTPKEKVFKQIKDNPENPFGSLIKEHGGQSYYDDPNGKFVDPITGKKQSLSKINKTREEGDWATWSDKLPSQFLSKQRPELAQRQLDLTKADKIAEFNEIKELTNPTIKKKLLETFANDCDSAAEHLKAAALPRQKYQVILPLESIKDNEVYARNYNDGETVALIRYPHGGTFEIPILTVNNKLKEGKEVLGEMPTDAIGINKKVADRLSGADFDGDTVMVIPCNSYNNKVKILSSQPLKELEGFDTHEYEYDDVKKDSDGTEHYYRNGREFKPMSHALTQNEMGRASNLITDMTLKGASPEELARAVKYSMVVIDAEKHKLDYKQAAIDNNIKTLKENYQGRIDEKGRMHTGASTLISRAKSQTEVTKRKGHPKINEDGTLTYKEVIEEYTDKNGKTKIRTQKSTQMKDTNDARTLISDANTRMENIYADYANSMKSLANQARKEMINTGNLKYDPQAKKTYGEEVKSLNAKLNVALKNAPRERQAQLMSNASLKVMVEDNPHMTSEDKKKEAQRLLTYYRTCVGAKRHPIEITDKEWEAIQAGAITENILTNILNNANLDELRERATPRSSMSLSEAQIGKIKAMALSGYSAAEIAKAVGVSTSTVHEYAKGG